MKTSYLKSAIRNFQKNKNYFLINIFGLCLGITSAIIIYLYVNHEKSFDKFYTNSEKISRLTINLKTPTAQNSYCTAPGAIGLQLKEEFPEIKEVVRMRGVSSLVTHYSTIKYDQLKLFTDKIFFADSTYFEIFNHEFLKGNPEFALHEPNTIVLTESFAKKIFGNEDPINKVVQYQYRYEMFDARVIAIIKDLPQTTHLPIDALVSFNSTEVYQRYNEAFSGAHLYTYFLMDKKESIEDVTGKFPEYYEKNLKLRYDSLGIECDLNLQSLESIHLESHHIFEAYQNGNKTSVNIIAIVGIFLVVLAAINYINIMTATSTSRIREVAMRKIFGAHSPSLVVQLLTESVLITLFAMVISVLIVQNILPWFNQFSGTELSLFSSKWMLISLVLVVAASLLGLASGLYPSVLISRFAPLSFMHGNKNTKGARSTFIRKFLVIFQLFISVSLIVSTILVTKQFYFVMHKNPGFNKENLITFQVKDTLLINHLPAIKEDIKKIPGVVNVAASSNIPAEVLNSTTFSGINPDGSSISLNSKFMFMDLDYIDVMEMNMVLGEKFDTSQLNHENRSVIINELAMRKFGWDDINDGKRVCWGTYDGQQNTMNVIGVVKDFQWLSLHNEPNPVIIMPQEIPMSLRLYTFIRIEKGLEGQILNSLNEYFSEYDLTNNVNLEFLNDEINVQYKGEQRMMILLVILAVVNIVIASLGLVGLISFISAKRRKEFSIRKVLGAMTSHNFKLVGKEFVILISIANIVAWPVTYFFMKNWLNNFAFRTDFNLSIFLYAYIISLVFIFGTITYHLFKTVVENPACVLRQE